MGIQNTSKSATRGTLFALAFSNEAVAPIEVGLESLIRATVGVLEMNKIYTMSSYYRSKTTVV